MTVSRKLVSCLVVDPGVTQYSRIMDRAWPSCEHIEEDHIVIADDLKNKELSHIILER